MTCESMICSSSPHYVWCAWQVYHINGFKHSRKKENACLSNPLFNLRDAKLYTPLPPLFSTSLKLCKQSTGRPKTGNKHFGAYRQGAKAGGGSSDDWKLNIVSGFCQNCWRGGSSIANKIFQTFDQLLFIWLIKSLLIFALSWFCLLTTIYKLRNGSTRFSS